MGNKVGARKKPRTRKRRSWAGKKRTSRQLIGSKRDLTVPIAPPQKIVAPPAVLTPGMQRRKAREAYEASWNPRDSEDRLNAVLDSVAGTHHRHK
jgi:hypothetical protein